MLAGVERRGDVLLANPYAIQRKRKNVSLFSMVGINGLCMLGTFALMLHKGSVGYASAYCIAYLVSLGIQLALMYRYLRNARDQDLNE